MNEDILMEIAKLNADLSIIRYRHTAKPKTEENAYLLKKDIERIVDKFLKLHPLFTYKIRINSMALYGIDIELKYKGNI